MEGSGVRPPLLMNPLLVFPDPTPPDVAQTLDLAGYDWVPVADHQDAIGKEPASGWSGAVITADQDAEGAFALARQLNKADLNAGPVVLLINGRQLGDLEQRSELFDDFCLTPLQPREFTARLTHVLARSGRSSGSPNLIEYGPLILNVETYQAVIDDAAMDLTYMEYELLKFLASHPGQVFTRETLLSRVWGYDYFGGARTVDVHVRRLRAKLGDEHSALIQTVRSVGYSFGESRWRQT